MISAFCFRIVPFMLVLPLGSVAATTRTWSPTGRVVYRETVDASLQLDVFSPTGAKAGESRPAVVFYFGGGWRKGSPSQFHPFAQHLASRGMVAICAEYRTENAHGTTPFIAVQDARFAMRWVRANAVKLGIDPTRIAAGGGSAGGHLAAACGMLPGLDDPTDDLAVSCRPDALVLFNPVIDNGPGGYGHDRIGDRWEEFSPMNHIDSKAPPTTALFGTADALIPLETAQRFAAKMQEAGVRCDLHLYGGAAHGFFNFSDGDNSFYLQVVAVMDAFFISLRWLPAPIPSVKSSPNR